MERRRTLDLELCLALDLKRRRTEVGRPDDKVERVVVVLVKREGLALRVKARGQARHAAFPGSGQGQLRADRERRDEGRGTTHASTKSANESRTLSFF